MEILLISLFIAIFIYLIIYILFVSSGKEQVRVRMSKYFQEKNVDNVQEQFIREKNEEEQKKKKNRIKLASHEFSNYIASSGLKLKANEFIYMWSGLTLIPMTLVVIFGGNIITGIALGIVGFSIPPVIVNNNRKKRFELFKKQLSESLVIIGNSIKGGFTFLQSLESIATDMQPPISSEFARLLREIHYGVKQEDALNRMVERTRSKDLELLVSAVLTSSQVGSNLSEILDTISATIRDRIRIKQQIRTLTSQGRISGIIIGSLPVFLVLILMIISPQYFEGFFESSVGKLLIVISIVLESIGFLIINKIIDIKM